MVNPLKCALVLTLVDPEPLSQSLGCGTPQCVETVTGIEE